MPRKIIQQMTISAASHNLARLMRPSKLKRYQTQSIARPPDGGHFRGPVYWSLKRASGSNRVRDPARFGPDGSKTGGSIAFSSEVDPGWRQENASKQKSRARF